MTARRERWGTIAQSEMDCAGAIASGFLLGVVCAVLLALYYTKAFPDFRRAPSGGKVAAWAAYVSVFYTGPLLLLLHLFPASAETGEGCGRVAIAAWFPPVAVAIGWMFFDDARNRKQQPTRPVTAPTSPFPLLLVLQACLIAVLLIAGVTVLRSGH